MSALLALLLTSNLFIKSSSTACYGDWTLKDQYKGTNFFDQFEFITNDVNGYVNYVSESQAKQLNMIQTTNNWIRMGVDNTSIPSNTATGRNTLRLQSKKRYESGLFVIHTTHMPQGCATHPAYWTDGTNWPNNGEIDIIEQVNDANNDQTTLHTGPDCDFSKVPKNFTGNMHNGNCTSSHDVNHGCDVENPDSNSFGPNFNKDGGGVFVGQWTKDGIYFWWWSGNKYPENVFTKPNTCEYGIPYAAFPFGEWCTSNHFKNHTIILDINLCGSWAGGNNWNNHCAKDTGYASCDNYTRYNPHKFSDAYWEIQSLTVFER